MRHFNNAYNYQLTTELMESADSSSETQPDMAMSILDILRNVNKGIQPVERRGVYDEDSPLPNLDLMDLSEIHEYRQNLQIELQETLEAISRRGRPVATEEQDEARSNEDVDEGATTPATTAKKKTE